MNDDTKDIIEKGMLDKADEFLARLGLN